MGKFDLQRRMREKSHVTRQDILRALRTLGLGRGDLIMVHSSLSSFGYVALTAKPTDETVVKAILENTDKDEVATDRTTCKVRGANTVIDALLECVGDEGVLMMPSFNHGRAKVYDPLTTPTTNGIIPDVFWRLPGVQRSLHPTHPYAAAGKDAPELLAGHSEVSTFGEHCPLGRLIHEGGHILLLGVGLGSCTAMHVAESIAGVPCLGYREDLGRVLQGGKVTYVPIDVWREGGECYVERHALEPRMRQARMMKDITVGKAQLHLLKGSDLVETILDLAREYCLAECPIRPGYRNAAGVLREEILSLQEQGRINCPI